MLQDYQALLELENFDPKLARHNQDYSWGPKKKQNDETVHLKNKTFFAHSLNFVQHNWLYAPCEPLNNKNNKFE